MSVTRNSQLSNLDLQYLQDLRDSSKTPKRLVIISDAGRDHDDEVALTVAAGLSSLGLVNIEGVVANLKPAKSRAQLIKGILNTVNLPNVPVGVGLAVDEHSSPQSYEFEASYMSKEEKFPQGQTLLKELFLAAENQSLTLLLISGLTDANQFIIENSELAQQKLKEIVIMGGIISEKDTICRNENGYLLPDESYNHKVDMPSAKSFYALAQAAQIPLTIVSRFCAMACAISPGFYDRLAQVESPIGKRLCAKQQDSITHLWKRVFLASNDPQREGLPSYCDKAWFLKTFTANSDTLQRVSVEDDMWPHVKKLNAYDPIALLAAVVPELFHPEKITCHDIQHSIIGVSNTKPGVQHPEKIRTILSSLALLGLEGPTKKLISTSLISPAAFYQPASKSVTKIMTNNPEESSIGKNENLSSQHIHK